MNIFYIGLGGFLGASFRYILDEVLSKLVPINFPIGILIVNIIGCFLIGLYLGSFLNLKDGMYYFFVIGFLESFTTMSAFSYQAITMLNSNIMLASSYIILTLFLTLAATYIGISYTSK